MRPRAARLRESISRSRFDRWDHIQTVHRRDLGMSATGVRQSKASNGDRRNGGPALITGGKEDENSVHRLQIRFVPPMQALHKVFISHVDAGHVLE